MGLLNGPRSTSTELADCDLVIEAVFEDMAIKKDIFARLDKVVKPGAILASNTSYSRHQRDRRAPPRGRSG